MAAAFQGANQRPREWRRRVSIRARILFETQWADCHILNISSRGMLLQYSRPLEIGSVIEVRQEGCAVPATVVWREGFRAGLSLNAPILLPEWVGDTIDPASAAGSGGNNSLFARAAGKGCEQDWHDASRRIEFIAAVGGALAFAVIIAAMANSALRAPFATIGKVLE
ncbi:MAG: PilZ domain-containing protein [Sphingomicrobium sp.]